MGVEESAERCSSVSDTDRAQMEERGGGFRPLNRLGRTNENCSYFSTTTVRSVKGHVRKIIYDSMKNYWSCYL